MTHIEWQTYGITAEQFAAFLHASDGRCAICRAEFNEAIVIQVDHDPTPEKVRGLLCTGCYRGLRNFGNNIDRLKAAIKYLVAPHAKQT